MWGSTFWFLVIASWFQGIDEDRHVDMSPMKEESKVRAAVTPLINERNAFSKLGGNMSEMEASER